MTRWFHWKSSALNAASLALQASYASFAVIVLTARLELAIPKAYGPQPYVYTKIPPRELWCTRRDSNSQSRRHWLLRPACIPDSTTGAYSDCFWLSHPQSHCSSSVSCRRPDCNIITQLHSLVCVPYSFNFSRACVYISVIACLSARCFSISS